jgi:hypothetical protein
MRRLLALLVLAASATLALMPPADAGGPTSVLISDPAAGHATGLYYSDAAYEQLDRMLADAETLDNAPSGLGASSVNLTWLIHDVQPWRTQQLYLDATGGPVVVTYGTAAMGNPNETVWSRPAEGAALTRLVGRVLSGSAPAAGSAASAAAPGPDPMVTDRVVTETAWHSLSGWRRLVPGLVAGLALGAGVTLVATRRRSRDEEPRRVLVDVVP